MKSDKRVVTNREIESLLESKKGQSLSADEILLIANYSGYGGTKGSGISDSRVLYEYYTDDQLVEKMWAIAFHYQARPFKKVLEPACGTGRFFKYAPEDAHLVGYDISEYACLITQALYPSNNQRPVTVHNQSFESIFFNRNLYVGDQVLAKVGAGEGFDLVIGNPPYGSFEGKYAGMGEKKRTHADAYDEYFISRGLDVLNKDGLLILVIGAALENGGTLFLDRPASKVKQDIARKGKLVDAYRLPAGIFTGTDVTTEIVVFQKN